MKFGVREICDVTFKTTAAGQKVGKTTFENAYMPAFMIDTAKTSTLEQASTTVYATGGKGNNRLIAWEGEKTMTFTVEDALISPMGLAVLSGAGLLSASEDKVAHVHITYDVNVNSDGYAVVDLAMLKDETGLNLKTQFKVCVNAKVPAYATVLDGSGAGIEFIPTVVIGTFNESDAFVPATADVVVDATKDAIFSVQGAKGKTVKLDFYLVMASGISEVEIKPEDFGGYFYVEAQTLYRREDTGLDMAAELIIPKVKVQSGFTFSMASSGDPSTFTFTMDAFPGYTQFDSTTKVMCVMQIIGEDNTDANEAEVDHTHADMNGF